MTARRTTILAAALLAALLGRAALAQTSSAPDAAAEGVSASFVVEAPESGAMDGVAAGRGPDRLLDRVTRTTTFVDELALATRKMAMFEGERYYRAPIRASGPETPIAVVSRGAARTRAGEEEGAFRFGWLGWTLLGALAAGVLTAWRLGWFTPFSQRKAQEKAEGVSPATPGASRRRKSKASGPNIELVKLGR